MNKQELKGAFSRIHASEELVKEVISVEHEQKTTWNVRRTLWRVAAVAAALAILVTALVFWPTGSSPEEPGIIAVPGVMKVYACALEETDEKELEEYELTDAVDSYKSVLVPYSNSMGEAIPFVFRIPDDYYGDAEIAVYVSVEYGWMYEDGNIENGVKKELSVSNEEMIRWTHGSMSEAIEKFGHGGRFYADIIIYADDQIVGYGIIDFVFYNPEGEGLLPSFVTNGFMTVSFPLVDGEYQDVSEEYVWKQIEEYKRTKQELEVSPMG